MAKNEYHEYLRRVPLFRDLDADELDSVGAVVTDLRFDAGDVLIRQGSSAHEMFIVTSGELEVSRDDRAITVLEPSANFYDAETGGIITPAVMSRASGDLYLTLRDLDAESVQLGLDTSPMIWLLWLGGVTTAAGGFWSLTVRRRDRVAEERRVLADV